MTDTPTPEHVHHGLAGIKTAATHKVGPLPAVAWAVIVVGLFYGYKWYKGRNSSGTSTPNPIAFTDSSGATNGGDSGIAGSGDSGGGSSGTGVNATNATWAAAAVNWLIGRGVSAADASNAVSAYLNGNALTPTQLGYINLVLGNFGTPPEGVIPIKVIPPTPPKPPVTPPKPPVGPKPPSVPSKPAPSVTYYYVKSGDTLWGIAQRYYGNGEDYKKIAAANHISSPYVIHPGQKLVIPK